MSALIKLCQRWWASALIYTASVSFDTSVAALHKCQLWYKWSAALIHVSALKQVSDLTKVSTLIWESSMIRIPCNNFAENPRKFPGIFPGNPRKFSGIFHGKIRWKCRQVFRGNSRNQFRRIWYRNFSGISLGIFSGIGYKKFPGIGLFRFLGN